MPTPRTSTYSVASGAGVYAGFAPPGSATPFLLARTGVRYSTLKAAHDAAISGDTIKVAAGTYVVDITGKSAGGLNTAEPGGTNYGIYRAALTIEWETPGDMPVIDMSAFAEDQGTRGGDGSAFIMGTTCLDLTLRGLKVIGWSGPSLSTANSGVRCQPGYGSSPGSYPTATLLVDRCHFDTWTNGIATGYNDSFTLTVQASVFEDCGAADGLSHGMYVNSAAFLDVLGCTFKRTIGQVAQSANGHMLKSRAKRTRVRASYFDGAGGCACLMDFSNGGDVEVTGNLMAFYGAVPAVGGDDTNPVMKYGAEQRAAANPSWDDRVHKIKIAQNTIRAYQPQWNSSPASRREVLWIYTTMTLQDGTPIAVSSIPQTVRNNIVGGIAAVPTLALWPDNSGVNTTSYRSTDSWAINDAGVYSGVAFDGSPLAADAPFAYAGERVPATARTDTFRGGSIVAQPAWRAAIAAGTWAAIGTSKLADVDPEANAAINPSYPAAAPWRGSNGQAATLDSWGSAVWDDATQVLWVPPSGGHGNYYGNESYRQPLGVNAPAWALAIAPTGAIGNTGSLAGNGTDAHFDGRPRSPHAYGNAVYVPGIGPVLVRLAFYDSTATSSQSVWKIDPTTGQPTKVYTFPSGGAPTMGACYDPTRNRIYSVSQLFVGGPLQWVVPDSGSSWTGGQAGSSVWPGNYGRLVYLPAQDRILLTTSTGSGNDVLCQLIHPTTGAVSTLAVNGSPPAGFDWNNGRCGCDWSPRLGKLVLWSQTSNLGAVATLTPDGDGLTSWTWGALTVSSGAPPVARSAEGTYGKWRWCESLGGAVLLPDTGNPTHFFAAV